MRAVAEGAVKLGQRVPGSDGKAAARRRERRTSESDLFVPHQGRR